MNEWERKRQMKVFKARHFNARRCNKYFLIGLVGAIMNWFLGIPILGLIAMIFFLLGVVGHLI
jgi:hypothetical protein